MSEQLPTNLPSLSVAQGEIARYSRTGGLLHLAHATRAIEQAVQEVHALRQQALANSLKGLVSVASPHDAR